MITTAMSEMVQNARNERVRQLLARRGARRARRTIDRALWSLEKVHLADRTLDRGDVKAVVTRLCARLGRSAPVFVVEAANSRELHGALLDWQEALWPGAVRR